MLTIITYFVAYGTHVQDVTCMVRGDRSVLEAVRIARRKARAHNFTPLKLLSVERLP